MPMQWTSAAQTDRQNPDYNGWKLPLHRAKVARLLLENYAVQNLQIERVTGYADTQPLAGEKPESEANQRITLSLTLSTKPRGDPTKLAPGKSAAPLPAAVAPAPTPASAPTSS